VKHLTQEDNQPLLSVEQFNIRQQTGQYLVENLNFDLYPQQTLAIVGESGSGKTITVLGLLGLLPETLVINGVVGFKNHNLVQLSQKQLQHIRGKKIAMIFQEPMTALNPLHSVERLIGESLVLQGYSKLELKEKIITLLHDVGLLEAIQILNRYPHELSGGQRQRVMIAMALALEPDILIADEPTTALDVLLQTQILQLLKTLQRQRNMAMIFISHDLNLVKHYANHVLVLNQGKVEEQGTISEIFIAPKTVYTRNLLNHDFVKL
jgi:microcin C transport system ATP-binding protein